MELPERIEQLVAPTVEAMGFEIVRVQLSGQRRQRLQIMVERRDRAAVSIDDCADVSRTVAAVLDVEDAIAGAYTLEVSSPGIDRPLVRLDDFRRFAGLEARVETSRPIGGRRRFRGRLLGVNEDTVRMQTESEAVALSFADIRRAKLVLTDELLAPAEGRQGQ